MDESRRPSVPPLNSCCGCLSLQTGSLIIGWYYTVTGIISLFVLYPMMYTFIPQLGTKGQTGPIVAKLLLVESVIILQMIVIAAIFLIYGIRKKSPEHVYKFVVIGTLSVIYDLFILPLLAFTPIRADVAKLYQTTAVGRDIPESYYYPLVKIVDLVFFIYLLLVVTNYYKELRRNGHSSGATV